MDSTGRALLNAILANKDDDAPRLIFADWLDENEAKVECGRCKSIGCKGGAKCNCPFCNGTGYVSNGFAERAEFIRVQCELARLPDDPVNIEWMKSSGTKRELIAAVAEQCRKEIDPHYELRKRERELKGCDAFPSWAGNIIGSWSEYRRGFIELITCAAADCLAHLDAIREQHPIREVRLTTWPVHYVAWTDRGHAEMNNADGSRFVAFGENGAEAVAKVLSFRWPGITFHLPEVNYPAFSNEWLALHGDPSVGTPRGTMNYRR